MLLELLKSLGITFKHTFNKPITVQYPEERRKPSPRARWRHKLLRYEDTGLERCIGCELCAAACPASCIHVVAAENTDDNRHSPGERYAEVYEINMLRCIFCGYCEDACPTDAIVLGENFELSDFDRGNFIYTKDMLLEPYPEKKETVEEVTEKNSGQHSIG